MNLNQFSNFSNEPLGWHPVQLRKKQKFFTNRPRITFTVLASKALSAQTTPGFFWQ